MLKVNVIGIGPGNPDLLTGASRRAIAESTILAGDKRMVGQFGTGKKVYPTIKLAELAAVAANADAEKDVLGILVSGDVGFFSLAKTIAGKLSRCEFCFPLTDVMGRREDYQYAWQTAESCFCCLTV